MIVVLGAISAVGCRTSQAVSNDANPPSSIRESGTQENKRLVESDETPVAGGTLVYGLGGETNGWNPGMNQWASAGLEVAHTIFDPLTAFDENGEIHPYFAERFEHNEAFTEWTLILRRGISFSNGKPANAEAVARAQNYLKRSPVTGSVYRTIDSITAEGEDRVVVRLNEPWAQLPMMFATQVGVVADPDWLERNDGLEPIGTGPFVLQSWSIGTELVVVKNPGYWQKDARGTALPYLDRVEFRVLPDYERRGSGLKAGDLDVITSINGVQIQEFRNDPRYQVFSNTKGETSEIFIQLNTMVPPFDDPEARRALAAATDTTAYNDAINGGFDVPAAGPISPGSKWYRKTAYPSYDPEAATALVERVKSRHGGAFEFTVTAGADLQNHQQVQFLQEQWAKVGIDMTVDIQEQSKLLINVVAGNYQASSWLQFDAPNPIMDAIWWEPTGALPPPEFTLNFARNKDEAIGVALAKARATDDPAEFLEQIGIVQDRLAADVPYIWLSHQSLSIIADQRVVNLLRYTLPDGAIGLDMIQGAHPLSQVWLRPT